MPIPARCVKGSAATNESMRDRHVPPPDDNGGAPNGGKPDLGAGVRADHFEIGFPTPSLCWICCLAHSSSSDL